VLTDPLQHVDEVGIHVDAMQPTGRNQALHDADLLGAELGSAEVPVFPDMIVHANHASTPIAYNRMLHDSRDQLPLA
jgi:hypothetical protein